MGNCTKHHAAHVRMQGHQGSGCARVKGGGMRERVERESPGDRERRHLLGLPERATLEIEIFI